MKVNLKIVTVGTLLLLLYIGLGYVYLTQSAQALYKSKYTEVTDRMKRELEVLIKEKLEAVLLLNISLAQNQNIQEVLLGKSAQNLNLDKYSILLKENTSLQQMRFHVISKEGVSLYRSWTKDRGDSILEIREDIASMIKNPKMKSVVSTGKFDMTFKSTVPVYKDDVFIGMVEAIGRFYSLVIKLKKYNIQTIVLVDKSYKQQLTNTQKNLFVEDYYVTASSDSKKLLHVIMQEGVESFFKKDTFFVDNENSQLICYYPLANINTKKMGHFIMSMDFKDIDTSSISDTKERIFLAWLLGFFVITGFMFYIYSVNYKNFLRKQQEKLEATVAKQTFELREQSEQMKHLAHHDSLTNLPNRLLLLDRLTQAIRNVKHKNEQVGVLFLDLDRFKEINDTYGHQVGDLLLQKITQKLKHLVPKEDTVARLGGDEFTIIVQDTNHDNLEKISQKIISEIQKPIIIDNLKLFVTFSIGVSIYPEDAQSTEHLLKYADTAMYRAKERGRNTYQFYNTSLTEIAINKLTLQNSLRDALKFGEFEPYFQPKIDANSQKIIGLEALVRWNHPTRGLVPPFEFISFAEEVGLIAQIDNFMLYATLKQIKIWHEEGLQTGRVSLNISNKQLEDFSAVSSFKRAIEELNFDTKYLELEVTESQIMKNQAKSSEILTQMKALGISISMDDFGTGYSSLAYLKNLPVDRLKIDRSFIIDVPNSSEDVAIVKTIISLAKNLGLDIIAEGVETKEQVDFLLKEGCSKIQGYYYSKPLDKDACKEFLLLHV